MRPPLTLPLRSLRPSYLRHQISHPRAQSSSSPAARHSPSPRPHPPTTLPLQTPPRNRRLPTIAVTSRSSLFRTRRGETPRPLKKTRANLKVQILEDEDGEEDALERAIRGVKDRTAYEDNDTPPNIPPQQRRSRFKRQGWQGDGDERVARGGRNRGRGIWVKTAPTTGMGNRKDAADDCGDGDYSHTLVSGVSMGTGSATAVPVGEIAEDWDDGAFLLPITQDHNGSGSGTPLVQERKVPNGNELGYTSSELQSVPPAAQQTQPPHEPQSHSNPAPTPKPVEASPNIQSIFSKTVSQEDHDPTSTPTKPLVLATTGSSIDSISSISSQALSSNNSPSQTPRIRRITSTRGSTLSDAEAERQKRATYRSEAQERVKERELSRTKIIENTQRQQDMKEAGGVRIKRYTSGEKKEKKEGLVRRLMIPGLKGL